MCFCVSGRGLCTTCCCVPIVFDTNDEFVLRQGTTTDGAIGDVFIDDDGVFVCLRRAVFPSPSGLMERVSCFSNGHVSAGFQNRGPSRQRRGHCYADVVSWITVTNVLTRL